MSACVPTNKSILPSLRSFFISFFNEALLEPDIILMDEPASGLINAEIDEIDNTLRMLSKEMNIAVLIVEHRIELLETIADRVVVMDAGEIIAEGNLEDVINNPKVKEAYFEG